MDIWLVVVLCIVCIYIGYAIGIYLHKHGQADGTIVVDKLSETTEVYCSLPIAPELLTGDEVFKMNVYVAKPSQQKQES